MSRVDTAIRAAAGATVVGLAGIAGAISYSHMAELAHAHGETGWRAHMFPLSVDGIEIVASLVLLADKRASRRSGWLPWAALTVGTAASLAANVAVGGSDWIGRAVAGWPALTLLVAVKLLFGLLEHPTSGRTTPAFAGPVPATGGDGPHAVRPVPVVTDEQPRTEHHPGTVPDRMTDDADRADPHPTDTDAQEHDYQPAPVSTTADVSALVPAARTAQQTLTDAGKPLTRQALARQMRADGHAVSNARASVLVKLLSAETGGQSPRRAAA
ncbi:DUF2637 domain-containing protein [Salinispora arenicola]|uniref:DUF2637 domain-containing protein n=1 Tax=Salinispora arenicola TaxID=168697 RepID=UPI000364D4BB|nr:DUF2637 domain-containing protein [Salinispora arenicola]